MPSCKSGDKNFDRLVREIIKDDPEIDSDDWDKISSYLEENEDNNKSLIKNGEINREAVKEYIAKSGKKMRPEVIVVFPDEILASDNNAADNSLPVSLRFYLERSGSMVPYDSQQSTGEFKSAIVTLLNRFPESGQANNKIYVVNDAIYPYPKSVTDFIKDKNIFESTSGLGNPSYTDFACIFDSLLTNNGPNQLSVLVSDMIYSTKDMKNVNPQKIFTEAEGLTTAVFKNRAAKKTVILLKMKGGYHGTYYSYNSKKTNYSGQRPYYFLIVADNKVIERLFKDENMRNFSNFETLKGFESLYCFMPPATRQPYHSILLSDKNNKGRFAVTKGQTSPITSIEKTEKNRGDDVFAVSLAVDLSGIIVSEDYKLNADNYTIESANGFMIENISAIDHSRIAKNDKKLTGTATHIITLSTPKVTSNETLRVRLVNKLPDWIDASSGDDDRDTSASGFKNTTFGLKYLMQGIYDSYYVSNKTPDYTFFEITLKH